MALNFVTCILRRGVVNKLYSQRSNQITRMAFDSRQNIKCNAFVLIKRLYSNQPVDPNVNEYCKEHNITITNIDVSKPITDIGNSDFPDYIKKLLKHQEVLEPTPVQAQGWPIIMSGHNLVGIAQTGSGKTLAYLIPAIIHLKEKLGRKGKGPRILVIVPTRELALQIESILKSFQNIINFPYLCIYGGVKKNSQIINLKAGVDVLIATPGRLHDLIFTKVTNLSRCSYVVLDEADQMLEMGFEEQIRKILKDLPYERQVLMFSATWPKEVQLIAKDYLGSSVRMYVGAKKLIANPNIKQHIYVCDKSNKMEVFKTILDNICTKEYGKILIFVNTKTFLDTLVMSINGFGWSSECIHGDKSQTQRDDILSRFKNGKFRILVATDVAARGLDLSGVTHVINYDFLNLTNYIHRIGRTARHKNKGESHTLLRVDDGGYALGLIDILKQANQEVPDCLDKLAQNFFENSLQQSNIQSSQDQKRTNKFGNPITRWSKYRKNKKNEKDNP